VQIRAADHLFRVLWVPVGHSRGLDAPYVLTKIVVLIIISCQRVVMVYCSVTSDVCLCLLKCAHTCFAVIRCRAWVPGRPTHPFVLLSTTLSLRNASHPLLCSLCSHSLPAQTVPLLMIHVCRAWAPYAALPPSFAHPPLAPHLTHSTKAWGRQGVQILVVVVVVVMVVEITALVLALVGATTERGNPWVELAGGTYWGAHPRTRAPLEIS